VDTLRLQIYVLTWSSNTSSEIAAYRHLQHINYSSDALKETLQSENICLMASPKVSQQQPQYLGRWNMRPLQDGGILKKKVLKESLNIEGASFMTFT
jgi:hypothetical protein